MHLILLVASLLVTSAGFVQAKPWQEQKCNLYQHAFRDGVAMLGPEGLRTSFLDQNDSFVRSGCTAQGHVCAEPPEEIALADLLTVMTMNEGMASTFVPFGCKPQR